jgi:hypothetical protein
MIQWIGFLLLFVPELCWGCSVCFGSGNSDLQRGFFWGILLLIILPFILFGAIAFNVIRSIRKRKENASL